MESNTTGNAERGNASAKSGSDANKSATNLFSTQPTQGLQTQQNGPTSVTNPNQTVNINPQLQQLFGSLSQIQKMLNPGMGQHVNPLLMLSQQQQQQQQAQRPPQNIAPQPSGETLDSGTKMNGPQSSSLESSERSQEKATIEAPGNPSIGTVPCRARGMPPEHNFQSAYFNIERETQHGSELVCCFPACRNKGIKFLYCAFCKDAVARRNFRAKHNHPDLLTKEEQKAQQVEADKRNKETKKESAAKRRRGSEPRNNNLRDGYADYPQDQAAVVSTSSFKMSDTAGGSSYSLPSVNGVLGTDVSVMKKRAHPGNASNLEGGSGQIDGKIGNSEGGPANKKARMFESEAFGGFKRGKEKFALLEPERIEAWRDLLLSRPDNDESRALSMWLNQAKICSDKQIPAEKLRSRLEEAKVVQSNSSASDGSSNDDISSDSEDLGSSTGDSNNEFATESNKKNNNIHRLNRHFQANGLSAASSSGSEKAETTTTSNYSSGSSGSSNEDSNNESSSSDSQEVNKCHSSMPTIRW